MSAKLKAVFTIMLALTMVFAVSACGQSDQEAESESTEAVTGGWEIHNNDANTLHDDVQAAFDKAMETYEDKGLKPVSYIASQVVSGTNHMILCETSPEEGTEPASYQMVVVYADLNGNAEITKTKAFDLTEYTGEEGAEASTEQLAGGWKLADDASPALIPEKAQAAFDKAAEKWEGDKLEASSLLGTQLVSGTNYAFICFSKQADGTIKGVYVATVYENLDGDAEVINLSAIDPAKYNE